MKSVRVFTGVDKKMNRGILTAVIFSLVVVIVSMIELSRMPRFGYNDYCDRLIILFSITEFASIFGGGIEIALLIAAKKNQIEIYTNCIRVTAIEMKHIYNWRKVEYELSLDDIQKVSFEIIGNCKYVVIFEKKEYKICLEEAEKCVELLRRMKSNSKI